MSSGLFPVRGLSIARFRAFPPGTCGHGSGKEAWREDAQWDYYCNKDKRDQFLLFVFRAPSIPVGALFSRRVPGTIDPRRACTPG